MSGRLPAYFGTVLYLDPPAVPWRGRLWSHLISDVSFAELHAFAELLGASRRGFDRDHYDLPAERFRVAVWLGATVVPSREIVRLLRDAGLRRPKHVFASAAPVSAQRAQLAGQVGAGGRLPAGVRVG
ncbi:DUF4031 domain-containing protein [Micromonospora sp. AKA38]|uniref:DUF4031 domain-containing protein n=1 Tax=Micromonospora sp. AKA38 TaxID=2733861 RepID=UPI0022C53155|nr:DUF4031 domain-containing protein [Micromonospora sp. AKA38]GHJ15116.1 hypothetical protein TPA0908_31110 [Micromonospora sp. AKA38]